MADLTQLSALELAEGLKAGEYSSTEVTQAHLDRIEAIEPQVKSFVTVTADTALAAAADVDRRRAAGEDLPLLPERCRR